MFDVQLESPIKLEKKKLNLELNQFKKCTVSTTESGLINKKIVYAHFDGKRIYITIVDPKTGEVTRQ